jgi:hypothetical protein
MRRSPKRMSQTVVPVVSSHHVEAGKRGLGQSPLVLPLG